MTHRLISISIIAGKNEKTIAQDTYAEWKRIKIYFLLEVLRPPDKRKESCALFSAKNRQDVYEL